MTKEDCRLCFKTTLKPIGIFTPKGIKLNVANTVRTHFPDEVSEDDFLPKFVCTKCWRRVARFDKFYKTVVEAKIIYLSASDPKEVDQNSAEIDCGVAEYIDDTSFVKDEPQIDDDADLSEETEHNTSAMDVSPEIDDSENFLDGVPNDDSTDDGGDSYLAKLDIEHIPQVDLTTDTELVATKEAIEIVKKVEDTADVEVTEKLKKIDELISDYMDMFCEVCEEPIGKLSEVRGHYLYKHQRRTITLKCCQQRIQITDIRDHIKYHLKPDAFTCTKCGRTHKSKRELQKHQKTHSPKRYECDICQKKFCSKSYIRNHIESTHVITDQRHECEFCKKCFVTPQKLHHHVKCVHERYYQAVCHVCAKVYNSVASLAQHLMGHSDIKRPRIVCQQCGKSFKDERILKKHVDRTHVSHAFQCPHCPKISPNRNALARHISSVHTYTVHKCKLCDKEFKRAVALTEHIATHTGESLYDCAYCPKSFKSSSNMYTHYRKKHLIQWEVDKMSKC